MICNLQKYKNHTAELNKTTKTKNKTKTKSNKFKIVQSSVYYYYCNEMVHHKSNI